MIIIFFLGVGDCATKRHSEEPSLVHTCLQHLYSITNFLQTTNGYHQTNQQQHNL